MELRNIARRGLFSWVSLGILTVLVAILAVLQYRWIGEVSVAEQKNLEEQLQSGLASIRRDFNAEINAAASALVPRQGEIDESGLEPAYENRYATWRASARDPGLFRRAGLVVPAHGGPVLKLLNPDTQMFEQVEWPGTWQPVLDATLARTLNRPPDQSGLDHTFFIDIPRFGEPRPGPPPRPRDREDKGPGGRKELNWLILELDTGRAAETLLPELFARYLGPKYASDFQIDVVVRDQRAQAIFRSNANRPTLTEDEAQASVTLFENLRELPGAGPGGRGRGPEGRRGPPPRGKFAKSPPFKELPSKEEAFREPPGPGRGRWLLLIRHQVGSLESIVEQARRRSLAVSGLVLLCLLVTALALVRYSRQSQRLAEIQMDFVASVSHELRTPLAVIRTAAYNLRGKMSSNPAQVEKYGALIQDESEKLGAIVEQVLRFSSARAGQVLQEKSPLRISAVIEDSIDASKRHFEYQPCQIEAALAADLPSILGDAMALRHAFQNLIGNAMKYGAGETGWVGITAQLVSRNGVRAIEIRFSDKGPGIPPGEQDHIFEPFYRGKKAVADQIHGTGLGLSLVKKIVEAHGGTIVLDSAVNYGTVFVVTIPAPGLQQSDELAHSLG